MKIFFSIAIPTYGYGGKGSEFLEFSFNKLKNQTFKNFEIIVIENGSTDQSLKKIIKLSKIDKRKGSVIS